MSTEFSIDGLTFKRKAFIVTVPKAGNRRFRVFGFHDGEAELNFLFSVDEDVPADLRKGNTNVRFAHEDIAFGAVTVELDSRQDLEATDDVVEIVD